jgi:hypothetical protein
MNAEQMDNILRDLSVIDRNLKLLEDKKLYNYGVMDPDYLYPTLNGRVVELESPIGLFQYYKGIQESLKLALKQRTLKRNELPSRAPRYLTDLVMKVFIKPRFLLPSQLFTNT